MSPEPRKRTGTVLPDDFCITVCDKCFHACCWHGEFMCDDAKTAGTVDLPVKKLKRINQRHANPEHWEYWEKDVMAIEWLEAHGYTERSK